MMAPTIDFLLGRDASELSKPHALGAIDIVFLDRDGTLNVHRPGYVSRPEDLRLLPHAARAVARINASGARAVLVTNQRGLALGELTEGELVAVHLALLERLARHGAHLDAIVVCPHREGECTCRKPRPGMLLDVFERARWATPSRCLLFGDQPSDLAAGAAAGVPSRRVGHGHGTLSEQVSRALV